MRSLFFLLFLVPSLLSRGQETANTPVPNNHILISAAFGVWATQSAESMLPFKHDNLEKSAEGFSWELQALVYNKRKTLGVGGVFTHIMHTSQYNLTETCDLSAHTHLFYLAPQLSLPIKQTAFPPVTGHLDMGMGTICYHNTGLIANQKYNANSFGLGINGNIGLEYPFHDNYAVGIKAGVLFVHCNKLNYTIPGNIPYQPEYKKPSFWMMTLCLDFKYYL